MSTWLPVGISFALAAAFLLGWTARAGAELVHRRRWQRMAATKAAHRCMQHGQTMLGHVIATELVGRRWWDLDCSRHLVDVRRSEQRQVHGGPR